METLEQFLATVDTSGLGEDEIIIYEEVSGLGGVGEQVEIIELKGEVWALGVTVPTAVKKAATLVKKAVVATAGKAVKIAKAATVGVPKGTQIQVPGKKTVTTQKGVKIKVPAGTTVKPPAPKAKVPSAQALKTGSAIVKTAETKAEQLAAKAKAKYPTYSEQVKAYLGKYGSEVHPEKRTAAQIAARTKILGERADKYGSLRKEVKLTPEVTYCPVTPTVVAPEVVPPAVVVKDLVPGKPVPVKVAKYMDVPVGTKIIRNGLVYTVDKAGTVYIPNNTIIIVPKPEKEPPVAPPTKVPWSWILVAGLVVFAIWAARKKPKKAKESVK